MSVRLGRITLAVGGALVLLGLGLCAVFVAVGDPWGSGTAIGAVTALVGIIVVFFVLVCLRRCGDVAFTRDTVTFTPIVGRRHVVPRSSITEVLLVEDLELPTRQGSFGPRYIVRGGDKTLVAFSPPVGLLDAGFEAWGTPLRTIDERSPWQLHRRYPGSVTLAEILAWPAVWASIVAPVVIIVGVLIYDANR